MMTVRLSTAGFAAKSFSIRLEAADVRFKEAESGMMSCPITYPWSSGGTKLVGIVWKRWSSA